MPKEKLRAVRRALLDWYRRGHRALPWRRTRDPYAVLVSEVMLQQTQVDRVLPKYLTWLERYPTLSALAAAPRAEVIRSWAPLGYNLRAVRLHEIARQAVEQHGGRLPETMEGLLALKGIGRYTAAAVACFAFGAAEPVMDTNVRRVLGRIFAGEAAEALEDDRAGWSVAEQALPGDDAYDWNQALMDLGATVCVARNPRCRVCPVHEWCSAYRLWFAPEAVQLGLDGLGPHPRPLSPWERGVLGGPPESHLPAPLVAERRAEYATGRVRSKGKGRSREERFEGSRRWFRGRIVDALRALPAGGSVPLAELGPRVKPGFSDGELPWLRELVGALAKDGLVEVGEGDQVSLPR